MAKIIVFDIGGTNFRSAIYDTETKQLTDIEKHPTPTYHSFLQPNSTPRLAFFQLETNQNHLQAVHQAQRELLAKIQKTVTGYRKKYPDIAKVSIAVPGSVDSSGKVLNMPAVWGQTRQETQFNLQEKMSNLFPDLQTYVMNDLTAAAYRDVPALLEEKFGGRALTLTISTGIGGKVVDVTRGMPRLLINDDGIGGEPGHAVVDTSPNALDCVCGGKGHLESYGSGASIQGLLKDITSATKNSRFELYRSLYKSSPLFNRAKFSIFDVYKLARDPKCSPFIKCLVHRNPAVRNLAMGVLFENSPLYQIYLQSGKISNPQLVAAINKGDTFAQYILDYSTLYVAQTVNNLVAQIGVKRVTVIGGFALALGPKYIKSVTDHLKTMQVYGFSQEQVEKLVYLGNSDDLNGLHGAAQYALCMERSPVLANSHSAQRQIRSRL